MPKTVDTNGTGSSDDIVTRCGYDLLSRTATQGWGVNSGSALWTLTAQFDEAGRRTSLEYPVDGTWPATTVSANYDPLSRLTAVTDPHSDLLDETIAAFEYDTRGRAIEVRVADGPLMASSAQDCTGTCRWLRTFLGYDELSRLMTFEQGPWSGSGFSGALSSEHHWTLDEQGNWNRHRDETSGGVEWQPPVDAVNAYQSWPTRVDYDRDGTIAPSETNHPLSLRLGGRGRRWIDDSDHARRGRVQVEGSRRIPRRSRSCGRIQTTGRRGQRERRRWVRSRGSSKPGLAYAKFKCDRRRRPLVHPSVGIGDRNVVSLLQGGSFRAEPVPL